MIGSYNVREQIFLLQDAQGQLRSEERKAKNREQGGRKCNFHYTAVPKFTFGTP